MQRRMPRFVGRGLPTVWDTVCSVTMGAPVLISANQEDISAIQEWAAEVDAWYQRSVSETVNSGMYVRTITLLNYHLHKLFVLSIFLPLQGVSYSTPSERAELLDSSRAVLKIESSGFEVWSSWDLVIITSASLILLQAWAAGAANTQDLDMVQNHLNILTCTYQTSPSLRHTLSSRLETALQQVRTPLQDSKPLPDVSVSGWRRPGEPREHRVHREQCEHRAEGQDPHSAHLFTNPVPDLNILSDLPPFEVSDMCNLADWPPFLVNMFGYGEHHEGGR